MTFELYVGPIARVYVLARLVNLFLGCLNVGASEQRKEYHSITTSYPPAWQCSALAPITNKLQHPSVWLVMERKNLNKNDHPGGI